jgi:hypothetical protein
LSAPLLVPICVTCPAHLILLDVISQIIVRSTDHRPHFVKFSTPLLTRPSWAQISSSALYSQIHSAYIPLYSQIPSAYIPTPMWETKFHTHTKQQEKL